ncbi:hypothetical protein [Paraburkholderia fungorum]
MTEAEWAKERTRLTAAATRARTKLQNSKVTLAEKLVLKAAVAEADEALRKHKLNYFELVTA